MKGIEMSVNGKVVLVTGASSGIGAATSVKLASHGAKVGLAARRGDRLNDMVAMIKSQGGEAIALEMDVVNSESVANGVETLAREFGTIDVVFNNAGLMPLSDMEMVQTDEWNRMIDVNIKGVLNTTAAVLPFMVKHKSGHVVNTSSIAGRKVFPGLSVYCATKHAVTALSDGMRMELGKKHNIRVTCIQPGAVETELYEQIADPAARQQMEDLKTRMEFLKAEDIAETVLFALQSPSHMDIAEVLVMPTQQSW